VGSAPSVRDILDAVLAEALPTDVESRMFHLVHTACGALAAGPGGLESFVAQRLREGQGTGEVPAHLDPHAEAAGLLGMAAGLGTAVLLRHRDADDVMEVLSCHLDRLAPRR
jgi:hypothetical protein